MGLWELARTSCKYYSELWICSYNCRVLVSKKLYLSQLYSFDNKTLNLLLLAKLPTHFVGLIPFLG